jgi:WD40 repeat protein
LGIVNVTWVTSATVFALHRLSRPALAAVLVLLARVAASSGEGAPPPRTDLYGDPLPPGAVARLGTMRLRHAGAALAFSADGKRLISCGCDGEVRVWDAANGALVRRTRLAWKPRQREWLAHTSLAPGGTMAQAWDGGAAYVYDTATGQEHRRLSGAQVLAFSPDGKTLAAQWLKWEGASVRLCAAVDFKKQLDLELPRDRALSGAAFAPDGKQLAALGGVGGELFLWEAATGDRLAERPYRLEERAPDQPSMRAWSYPHAAFAPDGEWTSVWLGDRVGLEEVSTGYLLATLPRGVGNPMVFSPDGRFVAAALLRPKKHPTEGWYDRKGLSLIEAASGDEICRLEIGNFDYVAFTPDGRAVIVTDKKHLHVWDTATGEHLHQMAWPESVRDARGEARVHSLAVLPGGRAATGMAEGDILVWDLAPTTWPARTPVRDLDRKALDALWSDLARDARTAYRAVQTLTAAPAQAVPFLGERLPPVTVDVKRVEKLLMDLDAEQFEVREAASRELSRMRYRVEPMLRRALADRPSLEMARRLRAILAEPKRPSAEDLRRLRAIAVLERIGTPEARRLLEKLSGGAAVRETHEAQAALQRLKRR